MKPAFGSLLRIFIVFVRWFFAEGVVRFMFVPMAGSVMFAMACRFVLWRTSGNALIGRYDSQLQNDVPNMPACTAAVITAAEYLARTYAATVESAAESATTGTTLIHLAADTAGGELWSRGFANVSLDSG
ncbi:MAG: hypothetical protein ABIQ70_12410 [Dokdonella sp.]